MERLPVPVRRPASPYDPLDATQLALRLEALGRALDDLPRQALRFARWHARRSLGSREARDAQDRELAAARAQPGAAGARTIRLRWPLRSGRPPGWRRRHRHEVHDILDTAQGLAFLALERRDTS